VITRFGTLYAGHVEMENIGLEGTPVNDRFLTNEHLATVFDITEALAQHMDRLGYATLWLAEHHFQPEGYEVIPNILLLSVHLAQLTEQIKFGCGFNVAPMWHPLRLAEDFATADILTKGRVIFGVGRGYHSREVETFGAPIIDQDANRELFEDQVELIFKAFNEESFSHHSKHYDIPPRVPYRGYELEEVTLVPRPPNLPVECWQPIVSGSQRALDFMAKHGIKGIIGGGAAQGGVMEKTIVAWRDALARVGRETELGTDINPGYYFHIADTEEKAIRESKRYFEEHMKMFGPLGFVPGLTDSQIEALGDPRRAKSAGLPTLEENVKGGGWMCGPPELIIERIMDVQEKYPGIEEMRVGMPASGMQTSVMLEQLEWFGKEVMPVFKAQAGVPVAASD